MKNLLRSILLLALWMVLSLVPVTVNAEENPIQLTQDTYKSYLNLGSYNKYYLPSGSYILMGDITLDDTLLIGYDGQIYDKDFSDVNVTLDLNGYVLRQGNVQPYPVIHVYQGSTLTIQDSRPDEIHKFTADGTGLWHLDEANGDKTVSGGVITGSVKTGLVLQAMDTSKPDYIARCTMNGGNIVGCTFSSYGGGVCVSDKAEFTMNGGSIRGCTVTDTQHGFGGGVYVVAGTFTMNGGTISDCVSATADGGDALYITDVNSENGTFSMAGAAMIYGSFKNDNPGASEGSEGVYTVTFESDGGTEVPPQVRPKDATAVKPDDPEKSDEIFGGWYDGESEWDFSTPVTANLTLTAKWISQNAHYHCICGGTGYEGHDSHTAIEWQPWPENGKLPDKGGNYYLTDDVTLPKGEASLPDGVHLCLNGKTVKGAGDSTELGIAGEMTVTDCLTTGSFGELKTGQGSRLVLYNSRIISGTFYGEVVNYGQISGGIFYGTVSGSGTIEDSAKVNVVFDTDGGSAVDTQKILRGQKAAAPTAPTKAGYIFDRWMDGSAAFDFANPVIKDITLTAKWTKRGNPAGTGSGTGTDTGTGAGSDTGTGTGQSSGTAAFSNTTSDAQKKENGKTADKHSHSYGEPVYTWKGTSCTAERVCVGDASHKETETVTATVVVTQPRTCTLDELSTYTAVFTSAAFAVQKKENVKTADKLGHDFKVLQHDEMQHWNKCSRCDEIDAKENHTGGTATCIAKAECVVCHAEYGEIDANNHSELEKVEEVPATEADTGTMEHWRCNACGRLFADAEGKKEITCFDTILAKIMVDAKTLSPEAEPTEPTDAGAWKVVAAVVSGIVCITVVVFVIRKRKTTETE
jgi:uncharacterized repeat protein (TIGR02543 family)